MKILNLFLLVIFTANQSYACLPSFVPVTLSDATFAASANGKQSKFVLLSNGVSINGDNLTYNTSERKWCLQDDCNLDATLLVTFPDTDIVTGVIYLNNNSKRIVIKQIVKPFQKGSYEVDSKANYLEFENQTSGTLERTVVRAKDSSGNILGEGHNSHDKNSRGPELGQTEPMAETAIDLKNSNFSAGCGGVSFQKKNPVLIGVPSFPVTGK